MKPHERILVTLTFAVTFAVLFGAIWFISSPREREIETLPPAPITLPVDLPNVLEAQRVPSATQRT